MVWTPLTLLWVAVCRIIAFIKLYHSPGGFMPVNTQLLSFPKTTTNWQNVIFSDEIRFCSETDENLVRSRKRPVEWFKSRNIISPQSTPRNYLETIAYDNRVPLIMLCETFTDQRYVAYVLRSFKDNFLNYALGAIFQEVNDKLFWALAA